MHHILSQAILIKGVSEVFMMIPPNVGLWFTIDPYVHFLPPNVVCNTGQV